MIELYKGPRQTMLDFFGEHHYLGSVLFPYLRAYVLKENGEIIGFCTFSSLSSQHSLNKYFIGQGRATELSRVCLAKNTKNLASQFIAACIREEAKLGICAVLSYANSERHLGVIYQALGFNYFGLTALQRDTYIKKKGILTKLGRKRVPKGAKTVSLNRPRKHIYIKFLNHKLKPALPNKPYPKYCTYIEKPQPEVLKPGLIK